MMPGLFYITAGLGLLLAVVPVCGACNNVNGACSLSHGRTLTYQGTTDHLENPDRGFLEEMVTFTSNWETLEVSELEGQRRQTGVTMVWRTFVLDTFRTSDISQHFLKKIRNDLSNIRTAGMTVAVRFCYIFKRRHTPYGDADERHILRHIQQLKPLFHEFESVIATVQAGFIGAWGEWYYTTYFGDPRHLDFDEDPYFGYTQQQWRARMTVLTAVLDAVPQSTQVQIRYPGMKMKMFNTSTPTNYSDVKKRMKSYLARIAHHNDCFLSDDTDVGTYSDDAKIYKVERKYLAADSRYLMVGGETCAVTSNDRDHCPTALSEMKTFHWTWLNQAYDRDMYRIWEREGCYEEVHRRLGYRLRLIQATMPDIVHKDGDVCINVTLANDGFAAPVKEMEVRLVMHSNASSHGYYGYLLPDVDVRTFQPGVTHVITASFRVPTDMMAGHYDVYLAIGDKIMTHQSDYYIDWV